MHTQTVGVVAQTDYAEFANLKIDDIAGIYLLLYLFFFSHNNNVEINGCQKGPGDLLRLYPAFAQSQLG